MTVNSSSSLNLTSAMTVRRGSTRTRSATPIEPSLFREQPGNEVYVLYANQTSNPKAPVGEVYVGGGYKDAIATTGLTTGAWTHLAETFDGSSVRLYVNGTLVATTAAAGALASSTNPLRIGGNNIWGEYFSGLIDEVRVYNRALSAGEIQQDMTTPITPTDAQPPSAPGNLAATGSLSSASLSWSASSDNVGVVRYDVYRSTTSGFTPSVANRIAQPTGTSYSDTGLSAGTYYYKVQAEDAAGNLSAASNEASAVVGDTTPPSAPGTLSASGAIGKATLSWGAASDNVGVVRYDVYRSTTSGFTPSAANRIAQPTGTGYVDTTGPGTYYYKVQAEDAAGNLGPASNEASAVVLADTTPPSAPANLSASVAGGTVNLSWSASSDDVGVVRYDVYRGTSAGFTPTSANRIAQPTGTSYSDSSIFALGTYYYKVQAEDAAGNLSQSSNEVPATIADTTPPTSPSGLVASVAGTSASLTWTAATDNVGVTRYDLYRSTTSGFTPSAAQPDRPADRHQLHRHGARGRHLLLQGASGGRGREHRPGVQRGGSDNSGHDPANNARQPVRNGRGGPGGTLLDGLDRQRRRHQVRPLPLDHLRLHAERRQPDRPADRHQLHRHRARGRHLLLQGAGRGRRRQPLGASNQATATVTAGGADRPGGRLRLRRGQRHDDRRPSGNGNTGTLSNATWSTSGKFGNALFFNGTNARVNVNDSTSLDLTSGMTLEAWVKPTVGNTAFQTVVLKDADAATSSTRSTPTRTPASLTPR